MSFIKMILAQLFTIVLSETVLDCPESLCPSEFIGDGSCDVGCMLPACNYDSPLASGEAIDKYQESDCFSACSEHCHENRLGDNKCNQECDIEECGWDLGDCGYCAQNCNENDLDDDPCDQDCLTLSCRFGNGNCGWCAENCFESDPGNGVCDTACLTEECNYDSGDCPLCNEGCEWSMIGNGTCEDSCNVPECDNDESDCICGQNCTLDLRTSLDTCYDECDTEDCAWQNGVCGSCASGCFETMLENTECDPECNNAACNYDNDQCGCTINCANEDKGNCDFECLVSPCDYDKNCDCGPNCNSGLRRLKAIVHHILSDDFESIFDFNNCPGECSEKDLDDGYDFDCKDEKCRDIDCLHQLGGCSNNSNSCSTDCKRCSNVNNDICFECDNGKYNEIGVCVDECSVSYTGIALCFEEDDNCGDDESLYCVPDTDDSTEEKPEIFTVDPTYEETSSNKHTPSDEENYYKTLKGAFGKVWKAYTVIELVEDTHDFVGVDFPNNDRFGGVNLTIKPSGEGRATIRVTAVDAKFPTSLNSLSLIGLDLEGSIALDDDCETDLCRYCPYTQLVSDTYYNDRGEEVDKDNYNVDNCLDLESAIFIEGNYSMSIDNCMIKEFRYQAQSFISLTSANLEIKNSNFTNVLAHSSSVSAFITVECSTNECANTVTVTDTVVSYVNNGYEYRDTIFQHGFIHVEGMASATFTNVTFTNNVVMCDSSLICRGLIGLEDIWVISITNCSFENNFVMESLISVDMQNLLLTTVTISSDGKCEECSLINFSLENNNFNQIASVDTLIKLDLGYYTPNIEIKNNQFNEILTQMPLIGLIKEQEFSDIDMNGGYTSYTVDNKKILVYSDPKSTIISENKITDSIAQIVLSIDQLTNVQINNFEVPSLFAERNLNYIIEQYFQANDDMYLKNTFDDLPVTFQHYVDGIQIGNLEIDKITVEQLECEYSGCLILLSEMSGEILIKDITAADKGPVIDIGSSSTTSHLTLEDIQVENVDAKESLVGVLDVLGVYKVSLKRITIKNIEVIGAGAVYIGNAAEVEIIDSLIENSRSPLGSGGAIYLNMFPETNTELSITNSNFTDCSANLKGGAIYITSASGAFPMLLTIDNSRFLRNTAYSGSMIYISDGISFSTNSIIKNSYFIQNTVNSLGGIYASHATGILLVHDCVFSENSGEYNSIYGIFSSEEELMNIKNVSFTSNKNGEALGISSSNHLSRVVTENCLFNYNDDLALNLNKATWIDSGSVFENNIRAINLQLTAHAVLSDTVFNNNQAGSVGIVCQIASYSDLECRNCTFKENSSNFHGGAVVVESYSKVAFGNCTFSKNFSKSKGGAISLSNNVEESTIEDTDFLENSSNEGGTMNIVDSVVKITKSTFEKNSADAISSGILSNSGEITIEDSSFSNQSGSSGVYMYATTESNINIKNSHFSDGTAESGGMINLASSSLTFENSTIKDCVSENDSGGIYANNDSTLIIKNSTFENISGENGHIYCDNSALAVQDSSFTILPNGGITVHTSSLLSIINSTFEDLSGNTKGRGIHGENIEEIQIESTSFSGLYASGDGGAIYLFGDIEDPSSSYIKRCSFNENSANLGGSIHLEKMCIPVLENIFTGNTASESGGAIFADCNYVFEIGDNVFTNNQATLNGGAISWIETQPIIDGNTYSGNSAKYGNDFASFPVAIKESSRRLNEESNELASGQTLSPPLILAVFDHYDQIVTTANDTVAQIIAIGDFAALRGTTQETSVEGIFNFSNLIVTAEPLATVELTISALSISSLSLSYESRECVMGEYFFNHECVICEEDTYSLDPSMSCEECPSEAECYGGAQMAPKPGYWRKHNQTDDFFACFNEDACLGGLRNDYGSFQPTGNCSDGYRGHLCQPCDNDYSVTTKYQCGRCPEHWVNSFILLGLLSLVFGLCFIMVRSSLRSVYQPKALHSIYLKIFVNYLQLVMLTAQFRLDWPEEVVRLLDIQEQSGQIADQIFSFDCFLATEDDDSYIEIFYFKLILMSLLPFILVIFALVFWGIYSCVNKDRLVLKQELITTMCVVFFLIHPSLTRVMFSMFSCLYIDGDYWLLENLDIQCWDERHVSSTLMIAVPAIIIWVLGVPTFILVLLTKKKKMLKKTSEKLKFGFLYNGYKLDHFYWEFVILYRKIFIICCAVFLSAVSIPIQALVCFTILMFCLHLQYKINPFDRKELNDMEIRAIIVATVTIYCGLYYLTQDLSSFGKYLFLGVIIAANLYFLILWIYHICYAGLLVASKFVPYLKYKMKDIENIDRPLISLLKPQNEHMNEKALEKILGMNSSLDFYSMIMRKRMKRTDGTAESREEEFFENPTT